MIVPFQFCSIDFEKEYLLKNHIDCLANFRVPNPVVLGWLLTQLNVEKRLVRDERYGTREAIELLAVCLVLNL